VHLASSPQLSFQNAYAKLAGNVDLRLRGTVASPSLLGRVSVTEGSATIAGTRYELQRGDIFFTNPVRIQPNIDLNATARVEDYDIVLGLHGTPDKMAVTYRSDPPLPEADVVALLALGRTENQQRIYTSQQESAGSNPATDALLGGALNATVSSRVQKLFGAGAVKVDPSYLGALGNSTSRITVEEQLGSKLTLTYATNVNTTAQQLLQAEIAINLSLTPAHRRFHIPRPAHPRNLFPNPVSIPANGKPRILALAQSPAIQNESRRLPQSSLLHVRGGIEHDLDDASSPRRVPGCPTRRSPFEPSHDCPGGGTSARSGHWRDRAN
jgi:hypothetical protein